MKRTISLIILVLLSCTVLSGCGKTVKEVEQANPVNTVDADAKDTSEERTINQKAEKLETITNYENVTEQEDEIIMVMTINDTKVDVTWENNASVAELKELAEDGLTISMTMYGGFEQVGSIGKSITRDDKQTTTSAGDIVLYSGNQLVVFYGSNSWAYTRLGKIKLTEKELTNLLSNGDVTITLSME
ncbi:hypothetical protein SAMN02910369_01587 [Lachnospiraceae bacterium NE2001]|nr:hypothetical protein SAMN02910369_01587 [Lachnospiraceae bacterium NE2001]